MEFHIPLFQLRQGQCVKSAAGSRQQPLPENRGRQVTMDKDKRKSHLRLVKPENTIRFAVKPEAGEKMNVDIYGRLCSSCIS
jgi:hypothetical protein